MTISCVGEKDGNEEEKKVQIYRLICLPKTFPSQVRVKLAILSLTISAIFFNSQNQGQDSLAVLRAEMATSLKKVFTALLALLANTYPERQCC